MLYITIAGTRMLSLMGVCYAGTVCLLWEYAIYNHSRYSYAVSYGSMLYITIAGTRMLSLMGVCYI